jgi:hypothetical protein
MAMLNINICRGGKDEKNFRCLFITVIVCIFHLKTLDENMFKYLLYTNSVKTHALKVVYDNTKKFSCRCQKCEK